MFRSAADRRRFLGVMAALAFAATLAIVPAEGQGQQSAYRAPRAADGHPDLNGIWQALNEANFDIEPHAARAAMALRPGPYVPVPAAPVLALGAIGSVPGGHGVVKGGAIPYTPAALKQKQENQQQWLERDPEIKCYLPGVPRATYMPYPFQIFQSQSAIFMAYTYAGAARNIYLKDPGPPEIDSWMGQSVGRWDGETLVIEVTGMNGSPWLDTSRSLRRCAGRFRNPRRHTARRHASGAGIRPRNP